MKTKVGDRVRVCYTTRRSGSKLSKETYRVVSIIDPGCVVAYLPKQKALWLIRSWVRCADMREGGR